MDEKVANIIIYFTNALSLSFTVGRGIRLSFLIAFLNKLSGHNSLNSIDTTSQVFGPRLEMLSVP